MEGVSIKFFPCDRCDANFSVKHKLLLHKWNAHFDPEVDSMYKCYRCDKIYPNQTELHSHGCFKSESLDVVCVDGVDLSCVENGRDNGSKKSKPKSQDNHKVKMPAGKIKDSGTKEVKPKGDKYRRSANVCDKAVCDSTTKEMENLDCGVEGDRAQCTLCEENFGGPFQFRKHLDEVHPEYQGALKKAIKDGNPFVCEVCKRHFRFKCSLALHVKIKHPSIFTPSRRMRRGMKGDKSVDMKKKGRRKGDKPLEKSKDKRLFSCKFCDVQYRAAYKLNLHMKKIHPELLTPEQACDKGTWCKICDKTMSTTSNFNAHMRRKHDAYWKPSYSSLSVDLKGKEKSSQTKHNTSDKTMVVKTKVQSPSKGTTKDKGSGTGMSGNIICKCGKEFLYKRTLIKHAMFCHLNSPSSAENKVMKSYICEYCGLSYWHKRNMDHHIRKKHQKIPIRKRRKDAKDVTRFLLKRKVKIDENMKRNEKEEKAVNLSKNGKSRKLRRKMPNCSFCGQVQPSMAALFQHRKDVHNSQRKSRGSESKVLASDDESEKKQKVTISSKKDNFKKLHRKMPTCGSCGKTLASMSALFLHKREVHNVHHKFKSSSKVTISEFLKRKVTKTALTNNSLTTPGKSSEEISSSVNGRKVSKKAQTSVNVAEVRKEEPMYEIQEVPLCLVKRRTDSKSEDTEEQQMSDGIPSEGDVSCIDGKYNCGHCDRKFGDKYSLGNHMQIWHIEKRHTCEDCNFTTMYPSNLSAHYAVKHRRF